MRMILPLAALAASLALPACAKPAAEPAHPTSTTTTAAPANKMGGCRDLQREVYLYAANEDSTQVVIVSVDARTVAFETGQKKTFDLATTPKDVHVWLDVYMQPAQIDRVHCTKHPAESQQAERYTATGGTLTITRAADGTFSATVESVKFSLDGRPNIEIAERRFERITLARPS
jgi:hypothetical protein